MDCSLPGGHQVGFPGGSEGKEFTCSGDLSSIPGLGRSPEEGMATNFLEIPWTEEPGGLQFIGLQ